MDGTSTVESLAQALALFECVGMPARNLALRTRREYTRDLRDLLSYLEHREITRLDEVRPRDLEGYLAELDRRGLRGSTRNRKVHTLKTFFKWLVNQERLVTNPAAQLVAPRAIKLEPRYLSEEEYRRLLRACSHHARDAAVVEVFLQTGMPLSELAHLTLTDVEVPKRITRDIESMGSVRVQRKGGKVERIPLNYKACQALAAYLKVRPKVEHNGLFVTKFKTRLTARSIEYMVSKYLAETGIRHASVHTLRHTMGRSFGRLVNASMDGPVDKNRSSHPAGSAHQVPAELVSFQGTGASCARETDPQQANVPKYMGRGSR